MIEGPCVIAKDIFVKKLDPEGEYHTEYIIESIIEISIKLYHANENHVNSAL